MRNGRGQISLPGEFQTEGDIAIAGGAGAISATRNASRNFLVTVPRTNFAPNKSATNFRSPFLQELVSRCLPALGLILGFMYIFDLSLDWGLPEKRTQADTQ